MISWSKFCPVGREEKYLLDAYGSGWVSGGEYVLRFEEAVESEFTSSKAYAVSNGTAALQMAFQLLGARPGDEIIMPSFCFQAGANVAVQLGLRPSFCDVEMGTWNQSVRTVEKALTNKTKGVLVVHNYGVAAPIREICEWARERDLWVIEDCAEAWFTRHEGKYVGQFGDIATFSMHATKTIASGEGGVVLVNVEAMEQRAALIRSQGIERSKAHYYHVLPGNNYRLSNLHCAIALAQFEGRKTILEHQRARAKLYNELLSGHRLLACQVGLGDQSEDEVWATALAVNFSELGVTRDQFMSLLASSGIEVRPGFYSVSSLPYYSSDVRMITDNADKIAENSIVLPTNASVSETEARTIGAELVRLVEANIARPR